MSQASIDTCALDFHSVGYCRSGPRHRRCRVALSDYHQSTAMPSIDTVQEGDDESSQSHTSGTENETGDVG